LVVNLPHPHLGTLTHPSTPEVLQAKERASTPSPSVVVTFGLIIESIKELRVALNNPLNHVTLIATSINVVNVGHPKPNEHPLKKMMIEWEVEKHHFPNIQGNQVPCSWSK